MPRRDDGGRLGIVERDSRLARHAVERVDRGARDARASRRRSPIATGCYV